MNWGKSIGEFRETQRINHEIETEKVSSLLENLLAN